MAADRRYWALPNAAFARSMRMNRTGQHDPEPDRPDPPPQPPGEVPEPPAEDLPPHPPLPVVARPLRRVA
ncbi:MAG: hypothetical protein ACT4OF_08655, partial [Caulobacteraceae bacterium]